MAAQRQSHGGVQAIDRAVEILKCFDGAHHQDLGISELARMTGLTTSTTHRLVAALVTHELLRRLPTGRYTLGSLAGRLSRSAGSPVSLIDNALDLMTRLRDEVNETVGLYELLPSMERSVIAQVESRHELRRTYTRFGDGIPLFLGGPSKAILAMLPVAQQNHWSSIEILRGYSAAKLDSEELRSQLAKVRIRGYAFSAEERTEGICSIASPVFGGTHQVTGAVGLSVPRVRMSAARLLEFGPLVTRTAWGISERLGASVEGVAHSMNIAGREPPLTQVGSLDQLFALARP